MAGDTGARIVGNVASEDTYGLVHSVVLLPNENRSICSCRTPNITGLPCKHAVKLASAHQLDADTLVHHCFTTVAGRDAFCSPAQTVPVGTADLQPLPSDQHLNSVANYPKRGRPPTKRKKSRLEAACARTSSKRIHRPFHCSICHQQGHTKRTCKYKLPMKAATEIVSKHETRARHHIAFCQFALLVRPVPKRVLPVACV